MNHVLRMLISLAALYAHSAAAQAADGARAVDLDPAFSVGERFHLAGMSQNTKRRHVKAAGDNQPDLNLTTTIHFAYDVEVLAVSAGNITKQRCRITKLTVDDGQQKRSLVAGTPTVLVYLNEDGYTKIDAEQGTLDELGMGALYQVIRLEPRRVTTDMLLASTASRSPGDEWTIDATRATDYLSERMLDTEPGSVTGTAQFVGTTDVDGVRGDEFAARLSSKRLRLGGVLPDGMQLTSATVDVEIRLVVPAGRQSPVVRESTEMTVFYAGRGSQSGISIAADHTAEMRESWTRTPLGK